MAKTATRQSNKYSNPAEHRFRNDVSACFLRRRHRRTAWSSVRASGAVSKDYYRLHPFPGWAAEPQASEFEFSDKNRSIFHNPSNAGAMTQRAEGRTELYHPSLGQFANAGSADRS